MLRAISTYIFVKERLHAGKLETLVRGGAQAIEIFCARGHFDYSERNAVREIAAWFKSTGTELNSLHSPMFADGEWGREGTPPLNLVDEDKRRRIASMDEIKRALEVAEQVPFRFLVQHLGTPREYFSEQRFEYAITAIEHLRAFAKPLGVTVLVENIPNDLSTPEKLAELIHVAHFEDVGVCFDTGHAHIMGTVRKDFDILKDHIRSTHIHDNAGDRDSHLWPGQGAIDWKEAMELLREAHHAPPLLLEIEHAEGVDIPAQASSAFQRLESALAVKE